MAVFRISLLFKDSNEPIVLTRRGIIGNCPLLIDIMIAKKKNWEQEGLVIEEPVNIPFAHASGVFFFKYFLLPEYGEPVNQVDVYSDYPEMRNKTVEELRDIIELGSYFRCESFVDCVSFIIADKIQTKSVKEIAAFLGFEYIHKLDGYDEDEKWMVCENVEVPPAATSADRQALPASNAQDRPTADTKASSDNQAEPTANPDVLPASDNQTSPTVDNQALPASNAQDQPTADSQASSDNQAEPTANPDALPASDNQTSPTADNQALPVSEAQSEPTDNADALPASDSQTSQTSDNQALPTADVHDEPTADDQPLEVVDSEDDSGSGGEPMEID